MLLFWFGFVFFFFSSSNSYSDLVCRVYSLNPTSLLKMKKLFFLCRLYLSLCPGTQAAAKEEKKNAQYKVDGQVDIPSPNVMEVYGQTSNIHNMTHFAKNDTQ